MSLWNVYDKRTAYFHVDPPSAVNFQVNSRKHKSVPKSYQATIT